jgi:hypothetical protein
MNDDTFLYAYRRPPDPQFAAALYQRLSAEPGISMTISFSPLAQFKRKLNILGGVLVVLMAFSPDVRAKLWNRSLAYF